MAWSAIDALDDARRATTDILLPFDAGRWLRLAVIAFFVGGAGSGFQGGTNFGGGGGTPGGPGGPGIPGNIPDFGTFVTIFAVVAGLILLFVLVSVFVGSVLEFVLVEGLRDREIRLREPFGRYLRAGFSLFLFRFVLGLLVLAVILIPVALLVTGGLAGDASVLLLVFPLILVALVAGLTVALIDLLTRDLVVPAMFVESRGVLSGWGRIWGVIRREWRQIGVYVLARIVLSIAAGIAVGIVATLALLIVAIPFVLIGGVVFAALTAVGGGTVGIGGWLLLGAVGFLFVLAALAVSAVIQVPVITYFRYYSLFVLGDVEPDLDVLADLRPDEWDDSANADGDDGDGSTPTSA
ncbi:DUF7544 domain-containing protein [Salinirubrum litoreum]|uniref:Membrane domain of glycerophosphoryl diester phosphodiesterase n=1 Tax=Salinirubrum litoreum TaxID=1126234 RepID=A0ABD5RAJ7_9EURY|nr:hypothetical protein [Salinirubrum litoreum]